MKIEQGTLMMRLIEQGGYEILNLGVQGVQWVQGVEGVEGVEGDNHRYVNINICLNIF